MSFDPPEGILDIGNATLRVGKLEVAETSGLNQGLQNIIKNDLLITENTTYAVNHKWGLKLPTTWVGEFEVKGHSGKYIDFNFYNENSASNAQGYNLTFKDTTMTLRYDGGNPLGGGAATIPTIVGAFRKVNIFFERGVISVSIDGTRYLYHKETDGFNQGLGVASRVVSTTGSAFVNLFIESDNENNSAFKNLRIVNGRFISDKTSNIAFMGGNLGVGVNSPKESLDIRGNMHFNRVSNVSQIKVDSNVVAEYTGPHDRPLRKYPEIILPRSAVGAEYNGYRIDRSSEHVTGVYDGVHDLFNETAVDYADTWGGGWQGSTGAYSTSTGVHTTFVTGGTTQGTGANLSSSSSVPNGEWVSLKSPNAIKLDNIQIRSRNASDWFAQFPTDFQIWGSNDGTTWSHIKTFTGQSASGQSILHTYHINSTIFYNRHALVVTKIPGTASTIIVSTGQAHLSISELRFNAHEEGDSSLDTTLKSVYNVPATTGTQLEVYYDAKGESTVQSPIPDLSPNTNTGAVSGHSPTLDSTDGIDSFKFDASSSQRITSTIDTSYWGTNKLHSVAFWFKADTINGKFNIFHIGNPAASESSGFWISDGSADSNGGNSLNWWFYGGDSTLKTSSFSWALDTWYHIALTFDGSTKKLYVNGKHIDYSVGNVITTLPTGIPASASLAVGSTTNSGDYFDGSIANFRVYGAKVLNTGQVQELYDYQKDYFLGSKSQVTLYKGHLGVGVTEPSGQLELAGDERIQEYPPRGMTGYETLVEGHGTFVTHGGNSIFAYAPWRAFNKELGSAGNFWIDTGIGYSDVAPYGALSTHSKTTLYDGSVLSGGWIDLICPYPIKLSSVSIAPRTNYWQISLQRGVILGSNNGEDWYQIDTINYNSPSGSTGTTAISNELTNFGLTSTSYYSHIRLVCTHLTSRYPASGTSDMHWQMGELVYFGTPGPTTLDKGSLTLGRSLDVPRISRYDVDTETPRPEKLVLDFDTNISPFNNQFIEDKSGRGNDGIPYGSATYSSADKAFTGFPSSSANYITGNIVGASGAYAHTQSYWINGADTTPRCPFTVGVETGNYSFLNIWLTTSQWTLNSDGAAGGAWAETIYDNRWYHVVLTYDGGTSTDSYKLYIDGEYKTPTTAISINAPLALPGDPQYRIGRNNGTQWYNGMVSSPKVYSVALEPSEVKKLYNLGRTGRSMILADTSLQIGAGLHDSINTIGGPRATLDVHGSILASSTIHGMSGNFHKMLGYARGGGQADHHRADNCLVAMGGMTVNAGSYASAGFIIRKSPYWMPFVVECYHCGHNSSNAGSMFGRNAVLFGAINNTSITPANGSGTLTGTSNGGNNSGIVLSASARGDDTVLFNISANKEGRSLGVMMCRLTYYYGIKGRQY